jgi:hypothetical protein
MPAPLFVRKPERCPYGHSLAPGMPQKISWLPCICGPAWEAAERGRGMGHVTLWCGTCSEQDHRDTRFYEPAARGRPQPSAQRLGDAAGHLSASDTTARATATVAGLACRLDGDDADDLPGRVRTHDAGVPARCGLLGCHGELGRIGKVTAIPGYGHGHVVPAGWFVHARHHKSDIRHFQAGELVRPGTALRMDGLPDRSNGTSALTLKRQIGGSRRPAWCCQQFVDIKTAGLVEMHLPQGMNFIVLEAARIGSRSGSFRRAAVPPVESP